MTPEEDLAEAVWDLLTDHKNGHYNKDSAHAELIRIIKVEARNGNY